MQIKQGKLRVFTYFRDPEMKQTKLPHQITCSREQNSCERCTKKGISCIYSRVGIIRRARKRKHETQQASGAIATLRPAPGSDDGSASKILRSDGLPQSHLASEIEMTEESLGSSKSPDQRGSFNALLMLNEASTATTVNSEPTVLDSARAGKTTRLSFKKHSIEWTKSMEFTKTVHCGYGSSC